MTLAPIETKAVPGATTFEEIVAGIDLTPNCEMRDCWIGQPVATHVRITVYMCGHRADHFLCESCADRQQNILDKWAGTDAEQTWTCGKCRAKSHAALPSLMEVRRL